jgi:hypothetical protein
MRELNFFDGITSATPPTQGIVGATALKVFANDAAYVTDKGAAAANGDAYYNSTDDVARLFRGGAWENVVTQPKITGTRGAPQAVTAGGGIAFVGKQVDNTWYVQGSGGAVTITANPRVAAGSFVGQRLRLVGRSDVNYVLMADGNGLSLNGDIQLDADRSIDLDWDGTNWREVCRN